MTDTKDLRADAESLADLAAILTLHNSSKLQSISRRINKAADRLEALTAEASLYEDSLASYAQENAALRARVAELEAERNHYIRDAQKWAHECAALRDRAALAGKEAK